METHRNFSQVIFAVALFGISGFAESAAVNNELVMSKGMRILAKTPIGEIQIAAADGLERTYSWEGASRSATLWPRREKRWFGSYGAYFPGPGFHWQDHNGIRRGVLEEGQQHFDTLDQSIAWLRLPYHSDCVYRNDGLVVCFSKNLSREQINVEVWQIYIGGTVPSKYQEGAGDRIWVYDEKDRPAAFNGSKGKPSLTGGQKPTRIPGSKDDAISVIGGKSQ